MYHLNFLQISNNSDSDLYRLLALYKSQSSGKMFDCKNDYTVHAQLN